MKTVSQIRITPSQTLLDGKQVSNSGITGIYREMIGNYPKFFKMDSLCKLGFVAAELLLGSMTAEEKENGAIIIFNRNGSLITDRNYQQTIADDNYFPSPALFVYTLANIVTGEIAIRHKIHGESPFYILENRDEKRMEEIVENAFLTSDPSFILTGWVDYDDEEHYLAEMKIMKK